jgi:uncharacterized protein (DUF305 family)
MNRFIAAAVGTIAALTLTACGGDDGGHDEHASDIPESEPFNQADVDFATHMVQHHAQALVMVDLTRGQQISRQTAGLAEEIMMAQAPEIELMTDWLGEWDQPVPETVRDHANAHGDGSGGMDEDMPGAMSEEDMAALAEAEGEEFEQRWLEMMIEHHEGAIEMAEAEQADGEYPEAIDLAETIESSQQAEIDRMEGLLGS